MKKLNLKSLFFIAAMAFFTLSSCKKNKEDIVPAPLTAAGVWKGLYGSNNNAPTTYFSFIINDNGTMKVKSGEENNPSLGTGTWKIKDGIFSGVYFYNGYPSDKYNVSAKIDLEKNTMEGSYGFGETVADDGTFTMTR